MLEDNDLSKKIEIRVQKSLKNIAGQEFSNFVLDKLGRGQSFLKTICLLPFWFNKSFRQSYNTEKLEHLGEANFKAWIGYTLYDYIRDGKIPKSKIIKSISVANIYTHEALMSFLSRADSVAKKDMILHLFNKIDTFYIKDKIADSTDFKKICNIVHEKSIAAAITAILVIPDNTYKKSVEHALDFFKFYFTARQLSDDLDDYKIDLKNKINTPVTVMFKKGLRGTGLKSEIRKVIDLNFKKGIKSLGKIEDFDSNFFISKYVKPC